jgi:glycopeptide antibiotics resistance protein
MGTVGANAVAAIIGGLLVAIVAFVPEVAYRYRHAGRIGATDLVALVVVPVYGLALWTYTLLPLPDPDDLVCRDPLLDPFHSVQDIRAAGADSLADLVTNGALAQVVLNVLLFVPLGVILRWRYRRGVVVAILAGFAISLTIETTQLTGIWGVYDCAYRFFDVDDLITNTTGAALGSLLSWVVLRHRRAPQVVDREPTMTAGQRIVATVCDVLTILLVGTATLIAYQGAAYVAAGQRRTEIPLDLQKALQWGAPLLLEAVVVLALGRTVGEWAVRLGTIAPRPAWTVPGRLVKLACGPGIIVAIGWWDSPWSLIALLLLAAASLVAAFAWPDHRGLANGIAGLRPVVSAWHDPPDHDDDLPAPPPPPVL